MPLEQCMDTRKLAEMLGLSEDRYGGRNSPESVRSDEKINKMEQSRQGLGEQAAQQIPGEE
jgi:hypothetical protein